MWIKWNGGECPVALGTLIEMEHRSGGAYVGSAGIFDWHNDNDAGDIVAYRVIEVGGKPTSALSKQEGGDHYKNLKIQPIEYIHANKIPFAEGCAIKYLTRWRDKGGVKDLEKAKHFIELLIELESRND